MIDRAGELKAAAEGIAPAALQAAKDAIAASCAEHIRWADIFASRLEGLPEEELHQFVRAFSLTLLGHLPTRPGTCPFCIQYGDDRGCTGCGYAATHGRCDEDDSAFSIFIEAFQELGKMIFQESIPGSIFCRQNSVDIKRDLHFQIMGSLNLAREMSKSLLSLPAMQLMEAKKSYIRQMIEYMPIGILSDDVRRQHLIVQDSLERYW